MVYWHIARLKALDKSKDQKKFLSCLENMSGEEKDRFKERGITFQMAKMGDLLRIWNFMVESFLPDEPTSRSALGSAAPGSMGYKMFRYVAKEEIKKGLRCDTSLLALDKDNDIVGEYENSFIVIWYFNHTLIPSHIKFVIVLSKLGA